MRRSILAGLAGLALLGAPQARAELVDRVAAVVNNDVITLSEVEKRAAARAGTGRSGDRPVRSGPRSARPG